MRFKEINSDSLHDKDCSFHNTARKLLNSVTKNGAYIEHTVFQNKDYYHKSPWKFYNYGPFEI